MKKTSFVVFLVFLSIILVGCQQEKIGTHADVTEVDLIYRLVTEKAAYSDTEPIQQYAELEYIGDKEKITIWHADSPFYFPMTETTRNYEIDSFKPLPLISTEMIKGEPLREEYKGRGGYSSEDKKEYIEFMEQIMDHKFPEGHYIVEGFADFWVQENGDKKDYWITAKIEFSVGQK